ncbi:MAG: phage major capsid protein [Ignavibacteria bacterium]|nr:phage major capsid protein [Ignavibacteria bacterium]
MTTLSKSIVNDAQFRQTTQQLRHHLAKGNTHSDVSAAFKAISYNDHATSYNSRTVRAVNLLLPQAEIANSNAIKYGQLIQAQSNAAAVASGTASAEAHYNYSPAEAVPRRIAHHTFATRQALATETLAQNVIDTALLAGVENEVDSFILNSTDVLSPGLLAMAGLNYTQTTTIAEALLRAAVQIRAANVDAPQSVVPNLAVLDSASWLALREEKDASGRYIVNPEAQDVYLWGLQCVESSKLPAKTALVLDSQATIVAKTALDSGVRSSDSHTDLFTRNILTLLGEVQCAVLCSNPSALSLVTLL